MKKIKRKLKILIQQKEMENKTLEVINHHLHRMSLLNLVMYLLNVFIKIETKRKKS